MSKKTSLSEYDGARLPDASGMKIGIVVAEWNPEITESLKAAAVETLEKQGLEEEKIEVLKVPGAFELPYGARLLLGAGKFDAIICLGCVIKGETQHNEYISNAVATALAGLSMKSGTPCIFGVLTPNNMQQAEERADGSHGNKGVEAAVTALKLICLSRKFKGSNSNIGFA